MELLKVQVKKENFEEVLSGSTDKAFVKLTNSLLKRIVCDDNVSMEDVKNDKSLVKHFDQLYISCMFSQENATFDLVDFDIDGDFIVFIVKNQKEESSEKIEDEKEQIEQLEKEVERDAVSVPVEPISKEKSIENIEEVKKEYKNEKSLTERINDILDSVYKHQNTIVVGIPRVTIKSNGNIWGSNKKLPLNNDHEIFVDIECDKLYFTYDMTEDDYINELDKFFKRMVSSNFVFIWKNRCVYKEVDGKRYLLLWYTTRKFENYKKKKTNVTSNRGWWC